MTGDEATLAVIDALESCGIPYTLAGSYATCYYGAVECGLDAKIVVQISPRTIAQLADRLGPGFQMGLQRSFKANTLTTLRVLESRDGSAVELYDLSQDAHDQECFKRRRRVEMLGRAVNIPTAEDVIVSKVRWASLDRPSKDSDDARNVVAVQGDRLDWDYVNAWCDRLGCRVVLDEIRRSIPPLG